MLNEANWSRPLEMLNEAKPYDGMLRANPVPHIEAPKVKSAIRSHGQNKVLCLFRDI